MHSKTAQLLRAVAQLVDKFGLVGSVGVLNSLSDIKAHSTTELRNFVVALTCAEFQFLHIYTISGVAFFLFM